jgi:hypothetical protein
MSEHSGVTGKTPHQVARADSLREITDTEMVRGGDHRSGCVPSGLLEERHILTPPSSAPGHPRPAVVPASANCSTTTLRGSQYTSRRGSAARPAPATFSSRALCVIWSSAWARASRTAAASSCVACPAPGLPTVPPPHATFEPLRLTIRHAADQEAVDSTSRRRLSRIFANHRH